MKKTLVHREHFIDAAKAIGIVLVVFAHKTGLPEFLINIIFSFHMPLFFFLSGYLVNDKKLSIDIKEYILKKFNALVVPYFFFGIISIFFYYLKKNDLELRVNIWSGLLYGTGDVLFFNVVLWFFTCLFVTSIIYYIIRQRFTSVQTVIIAFILGSITITFTQDNNYRLPWNFELSFIALFFYSFGQWMSSFEIQNIFLQNKRMILKLFFLCITVFIVANFFLKRVDMNSMQFGNPIIFYGIALLGIFLILVISMFLKENKLIIFLSKNTIVIFPLHTILFSIFTAIGIMVFQQTPGFQNTFYFAFIYTFTALLVVYPIAYLLNKYCPLCIGREMKKKVIK